MHYYDLRGEVDSSPLVIGVNSLHMRVSIHLPLPKITASVLYFVFL